MNLNIDLTLSISMNSKIITDLNVKFKGIQLLEKVEENLHGLNFDDEFLIITPIEIK